MERHINIELLIKSIRARPGVYNPQHKDYFNRNAVDQLWKEIGDEMSLNVNTVKAKWNHLRNSFARVCRQNNESLPGKTSRPRKTWYLEDKMSFLKNCLRKRKIGCDRSGIDSKYQEDMSSNIPDDEYDDPMKIKVSRRRTNITELPSFEEISKSTIQPTDNVEISKQYSSRPSTADELFFQSILNESQTLSEAKRRKFKLAIQSLLNDFIDEEELKGSSGLIIERAYTKCEDYT